MAELDSKDDYFCRYLEHMHCRAEKLRAEKQKEAKEREQAAAAVVGVEECRKRRWQ
jgi:hypothetical protein